MDREIGVFDSFRVEEAYSWRDDIMEITRRIVHEIDEARLNNIAEHFNVDLSEIREFPEMKQKKMEKPQTKRGKWKPIDLTYGRNYYFCSACEETVDMPTAMGIPMFRYCPNCGADMRPTSMSGANGEGI